MRARPPKHCLLALLLLSLACGCGPLYRSLGGDYAAARDADTLSAAARELLDRAVAPLQDEGYVDLHVHMISSEVDPKALSPWQPVQHGRLRVLLAAAGVDLDGDWAAEHLARLASLDASAPLPARRLLYALDRAYDRDGRADEAATPLYVANRSVIEAACAQPGMLLPVISIHPYRHDALQRLDHYAAMGLRFIKWLPNSMGMDPADPALDPFYARLAEHDMTLLSHTGAERAIPAAAQELGNPLRLRRALDAGVRVVALHAAGDGRQLDLDHPDRPRVQGWQLLLRLLDEPRSAEQLYLDSSALAFRTHSPEPLATLLGRPDLQDRLLHGSDYPLSAVYAAVSLRRLVRQGFLDPEQRPLLAELRDWNPLLFALLLERSLRHPELGRGFDLAVFQRGLPGMDDFRCPAT